MKLIFFRKLTLGVIGGILLSSILLLVFALILSKQADPQKNLELFSFLSLALGSVAAGKLSTLGLENKWLQALTAAAVFSLFVLILSVIFSDFTSASLVKLLITAILTFTGAMIGKKNHSSVSTSKRRKAVIKRYAR